MLKIGEFSKLSHLTVKALRFYERKGLLMPSYTDRENGYRYYETSQLHQASRIKSYRQMDLTIDEIKAIFSGEDEHSVLSRKEEYLLLQKHKIDSLLSTINTVLEDKEMKYHVTEKVIPEALVYSAETVLEKYSDFMEWIPSVGQMCLELNPGIKCAEPEYEFCEYLDGEYKESNIRVRHSEAVTARGIENDIIKFRVIPETRVLSIFHKGDYESIGQAYAFIMNYAEKNGYSVCAPARECYIDGIWNKDSSDDYLTEIQLPVEEKQ